jgi:peptide/nickel transport system permease protein
VYPVADLDRPTEDEASTPVQTRRSRRLWRARRSALSWVGATIILALFLIAVFGEYVAPYPEHAGAVVDFSAQLQPPSAAHIMGTDEAGRDVFSRVIIGTRVSLLTGVAVVLAGSLIGVAVGLIGGYLGGVVNVVLMRIADVFLAIPGIALALAFAAVLRPSLTTTMIAISLVWWPWMARLVQAEVLSIKQEAFVDASRTYGASHLHIILHDILPNVTSVIVVKASLDVGFAILLVAALGFLGVGAQPPIPEWGAMIANGRAYLPTSWWLSTFPGVAIFIAVLGFNLFGDTLRDVMDVKYEA